MSWFSKLVGGSTNDDYGPVPDGMEEYPVGSGNYIRKSNIKPRESVGPWANFRDAPSFVLSDSLKRSLNGVGDGFSLGLKFSFWWILIPVLVGLVFLFSLKGRR